MYSSIWCAKPPTYLPPQVKAQDFALILASEPIFATLFAIVLVGTSVGTSDVIGGALVVLACLSNEVNFAFFSRYVGGRKAAPKVVDV